MLIIDICGYIHGVYSLAVQVPFTSVDTCSLLAENYFWFLHCEVLCVSQTSETCIWKSKKQ